MNFNSILKALFGDKSSRDMKKIQPFVEKVLAVSPQIEVLDNDALRARTQEIRQQVQAAAKTQKEEIEKLKATIEDTPLDERADIFAKIDKKEKEALDEYEKAEVHSEHKSASNLWGSLGFLTREIERNRINQSVSLLPWNLFDSEGLPLNSEQMVASVQNGTDIGRAARTGTRATGRCRSTRSTRNPFVPPLLEMGESNRIRQSSSRRICKERAVSSFVSHGIPRTGQTGIDP